MKQAQIDIIAEIIDRHARQDAHGARILQDYDYTALLEELAALDIATY